MNSNGESGSSWLRPKVTSNKWEIPVQYLVIYTRPQDFSKIYERTLHVLLPPFVFENFINNWRKYEDAINSTATFYKTKLTFVKFIRCAIPFWVNEYQELQKNGYDKKNC